MRDGMIGAIIGSMPIITLVFVVLRCFEVNDWGWLWVFSPTWISIGLTLLISLAVFLNAFIGEYDGTTRINRKNKHR